MRDKFTRVLDLLVEHFAGGKAGQPNRTGFVRTAVLSLVLAAVLLVLLILDESSRLHTRFGLDIPLLVITLVLTAGLLLCAVRSIQYLRKNKQQ
ncbi:MULTISPECIES: hypothetical protein [Caproicibacterium]|jgi:hypothetical protein|uniref:DUF202 domain-containing protein n=1 Tax=Caproicibacterium lactatifermentans TaxID=2666138 RepID=A0A859DRH0_9FIRM|nr:hypothetical protein [Caproicibacterium lactatifermentans]ARP50890.1 hypothetical protein B6259_08455 [Ruminococcaceae bacterium CPB6]MDD4807359.1 hypothetical protein [Oscillospiraceae bacterium]QKN23382.1 hypothetical protein GJQ69_02050 [Caproicibacterium lactatifermentans]QKO29940.1 hypothetical protein GKP14_02310 [Caproicibacterium lactatifermentans]